MVQRFVIRSRDLLSPVVSFRSHGTAKASFTSSAVDSSSLTKSRVAATNKWFESIVIGEKLCPFAPPLLPHDTLRIVPSRAENAEEAVNEVAHEANLLVGDGWGDSMSGTKPETTLLVLDASFVQDFRDFVHLSWTLQSDAILSNGFGDKIQLVLFHPDATHQTYASRLSGNDDNPGDYTIRSPFPTVHLLREVDVLAAVSSGYSNLESLPARNQARFISQGVDVCRSRLERCFHKGLPTEPRS